MAFISKQFEITNPLGIVKNNLPTSNLSKQDHMGNPISKHRREGQGSAVEKSCNKTRGTQRKQGIIIKTIKIIIGYNLTIHILGL